MSNKLIKDPNFDYSIHWELDGLTIPEACKKLQEFQEAYKDRFCKIVLSYQPRQYEDGDELVLAGYRPETEKEKAAREKQERELAELREKRDRAQFEALRKKFQ